MAFFVLVHGGFYGGWCWKKVRSYLEAYNHTVYTPTLTGLGERSHLHNASITLDTHIKDIYNTIVFEDLSQIILVGHSYGGLVITGVAAQLSSRIKHLVYLDALVPHPNDSLFSLVGTQAEQFFIAQATIDGNGWSIPPLALEDNAFADPTDVAWCREKVTPQTVNSFCQPLFFNEQAVANIPKQFIYCTQNPHTIMRDMRHRAQTNGWGCFDIPTGHFPMIEAPEIISGLLLSM